MSLFPAYGQNNADTVVDEVVEVMDVQDQDVSPAREAQLLESDEEPQPAPVCPPPPSIPALREDFYIDPKSDNGNLRVSTLYYPGRPQYARASCPLGQAAEGGGRGGRKRRRYFEAGAEEPRLDEELAARVAAFRRMLADAPDDADLWLRFIRFQERCSGAGAALAAAVEGVSRAPHARALHVAHHRLARHHLPPDTYLSVLRDHIASESRVSAQAELWVRLLAALAASPSSSAQGLAAAARAAVARLRTHAPAYPHLIYAYGSFLRAAGLWEELVMLVELLASMSFPPSAAFPPPRDRAREAAIEQRLLDYEDKVAASGLPLSARWVRVERARAGAHWRAPDAAGAEELRADPQRAPAPHALAELLLPVPDPPHAFLLAAHVLRLAKVPMLPCAGYVVRAWSLGAVEATDGCAEALLPLLRAARRLPPAHAARPAPAPAASLMRLLADPPHYFSDDNGYLSWTQSLWSAALQWTSGVRREALLAWQLRWLHSLTTLADPQTEAGRAELRRIRGVARASLKAHARGAPLAFAQFARLEQACGGGGATVAAHALRAALRDHDLPAHHKLYVARVAAEMPGLESCGLWGVTCAVLGRPLPDDAALSAPPPSLVRDALRQVEERCDEIDAELADATDSDELSESSDGGASRLCAALLPGRGEWASARAILAPPHTLRALLQRATPPPTATASWEACRWGEQAACALAAAARRLHTLAPAAARLAPHYPHNGFLALACSGAGAGVCGAAGAGGAAERRQTESGALAEMLPAMHSATAAWESGSGPERACAARAAARAARRAAAGGGALAWAALLEASARADVPQLSPARALPPATAACPSHKWLYVRGALWAGAGAALADVLLDKQLRLHALPIELDAAAEVAGQLHANDDTR